MVIAILIVIPEYWCDYSCLQRCLLAVWSMWYLATSRWPRICFSLPLTFFFCIFSLILVPPPPLLPPTGTFIHQIKTQIGSCISFVWAHISHSPFLCSQTRKRARRVAVNPSNPHMVRLFSHRNITAAAIKCTSIRAILHFYPETFFVQHFYTFL